MADTTAATITKTLYTGTETPIAPGAASAQKKIEVTLQPVETAAIVVPEYAVTGEKAIILNLETTGVLPWESRIADIGVKVVGDPLVPVIHFNDADEATLLRSFASWYAGGGYTQIIGYNVDFDFRFLFVTCMKYGIKIPSFATTALYDLQEVMQQVFTKYTYGFNASGKLDEWALYLFNKTPPDTQEGVLQKYAKGDIEAIREYNEYKVSTEFLLLSLIEYVLTP